MDQYYSSNYNSFLVCIFIGLLIPLSYRLRLPSFVLSFFSFVISLSVSLYWRLSALELQLSFYWLCYRVVHYVIQNVSGRGGGVHTAGIFKI